MRMMQWIGALCVIGACGSCGFSMAATYKSLERDLRQLKNSLEIMSCQMEYRLTALPELCGIVSSACTGSIAHLFRALGRELETGGVSDVEAAMLLALEETGSVPSQCTGILRQLAGILGQTDLGGQLKGLEAVKSEIQRELSQVEIEKEGRMRSYRALGLCGGMALAILLL